MNGGEVWVHAAGAGGDDAGVEDEGEDGEQNVDVEEGRDFLAADGGEFAAHVQDHDGGHAEREQVHEAGGRFEDDGVGEGDAAGVAGREDRGGLRDRVRWADEGAEREGHGRADGGEGAEGHAGGVCDLANVD